MTWGIGNPGDSIDWTFVFVYILHTRYHDNRVGEYKNVRLILVRTG